jgi:hypothetical protein
MSKIKAYFKELIVKFFSEFQMVFMYYVRKCKKVYKSYFA